MAVGRRRGGGRGGKFHAGGEGGRRGFLAGCLLASSLAAGALGSHVFASATPPLPLLAPQPTARAAATAALAEAEVAALVVGSAVEPVPVPRVLADLEPDTEQRSLAAALVAQLGDDGVRWSAGEALWQLQQLGDAALAPLEQALDSSDLQQRHLAAHCLRRLQAKRSPALCRVSVEALARPGSWHEDYYSVLCSSPAAASLRWLVEDPDPAVPELRRALRQGDAQQRLLAAFALSKSRSRHDLALVCRILVDHLNDNDIQGDALLASHGLYCLGREALGEIRLARRYADAQGLLALTMVEAHLVEGPLAAQLRAALPARPGRQLTDVYWDPIASFSIHRSSVPRL